MKKFMCGLGGVLALCTLSAEAANREIRALFQPDSSQPNKNVFVNKTPNSGYCATFPSQCLENDVFSIQLPVRFLSVRAVVPGDSIPLKVPANWRQLTVTNQDTQETETVEVRIIGIGSQYLLSQPAAELVGVPTDLEGHQQLWNRSWVYAPAPCQYSGVGVYTPRTYGFFWKAPVEAACVKIAAYSIPSMSFETVDFAYELRTPNPLGMSSGLYTGTMNYVLGPGADFDFGPLMQPDDSQLTLDFVLDVQHTLKVELPPGGNKVSLEPDGGWQQWINNGRKPTRIYKDQLFYLSASSRFKVMMLCDSSGGERCMIRSPTGRSTEVMAMMTLPQGFTGPGGDQGKLFPLAHNVWRGPFLPGLYVDRKAGSLRFEIPADAVDSLLQPGLTDTLRGDITILWDSEA